MDGLMKRDEAGRDGWATGAIGIVRCWLAAVDWYVYTYTKYMVDRRRA
jgi:hypothetical protein